MEVFLLFVLYSFFGCVLEDLYYFLLHRKYISKRTLINLPLCPVYGISALVLLAVNGETKNILLLFVNGFFAVSAVELCYFLVSRMAYDIKWWDYSERKINLMGGISAFYSCMWGILNIPFAHIVHPVCHGWIASFSEPGRLLLGLFLAVYLAADIKETHKELIKRKKGENNEVDARLLYLKHNN